MKELWTEKYRPKSLSDYFIDKQQLDKVKLWIKNFIDEDEDMKPFLVLYGSTGIGKTTLAHLIFKKYNFEVIECNASDSRSKKSLNEIIGTTSKYSICTNEDSKKQIFKKVGIIMDEIDGLCGGEIGGVQELIKITIEKNRKNNKNNYVCPVICTSNSIKEKKLLPILKNAVVIHIQKPSSIECNKLIKNIYT